MADSRAEEGAEPPAQAACRPFHILIPWVTIFVKSFNFDNLLFYLQEVVFSLCSGICDTDFK